MTPFTSSDIESAQKAIQVLSLHKSCLYVMDRPACMKVLDGLASNNFQLRGIKLSEEDLRHIRCVLDYCGSKEIASLFTRRAVKKNQRPCLICTQQKVKVSDS